jgi:hypothetical protein
MKTIRNYVYAAVLAATALNFAPTLASAQEPAHGKFTLSHDVRWGNAKLPAGEYAFSFDPTNGSRMLTLSKISGVRTGYMVLVPDTDDSKPSDVSRLVLEATPEGTYVSAMQLPEFGMTLRFTVPSHATIAERQVAKAGTLAVASVQ